MRKVIVVVLLAAIVGYVAVEYFRREAVATNQQSDRTIVAVETARIRKADLGDRVMFTGTIRAEERYDAAPKISGIVRKINFNVGDIVTRGDVLATLDDDEYILEVEQAEASLLVARAEANDARSQLEITRRDYERAANLRRENVISAQEFDRTDASNKAQEAKHETALAQVRLAEAELKSAKVQLGYTRVIADWTADPVKRVIGQRYIDAGGMAIANGPILSVLDIDNVKAIIAVSEKEYPKIALEDKVIVTTDAFPGRQFIGNVARIPQELGILTREAEIEVAIDNSKQELKPGMFVRADIEFQRRDGATAVPLEAVVRRDDGSLGVYLVNADRTRVSFQPITEGIRDGGWVELIDALSLLDREVVVMGQHLLKDGAGIKVAGGTGEA